jgi:hypothetical protein
MIHARQTGETNILSGNKEPDMLYIDGKLIPAGTKRLFLEAGRHRVIAAYRTSGRTYLAFAAGPAGDRVPPPALYPLAMSWYNMPGLLPFDGGINHPEKYCWFRFSSPPGLSAMEIPCADDLRVWQAEPGGGWRELPAERPGPGLWNISLKEPAIEPALFAIRVEASHGRYAGALIDEVIRFSCGAGKIETGDWSKIDGLASYSGGALYSARIKLPEKLPPGHIRLEIADLGSSARVTVNGTEAEVRAAPPWHFVLDGLLRPGENEIAVTVHNTLSNHYQSIPTRYRGESPSGILGRAFIRFYTEEK